VSAARFKKPAWCYLFLLLAGFLFGGCASTDPSNESVRPWNAPKDWENGMPAGMMEGR
jgi:hypothetical protein